MVKLIFLCRRRPEITREVYAERLLRGHVPLALEHHPTLRRYIVNIVEREGGGEEIDSVGELTFDSLADFRERLYATAEGRAAIERDVAGFLAGADAYATTEHVQKSTRPSPPVGSRTPGIKMVCPVRRLAGLSHGEFVDHWLGRHVPLALEHHPGLCRYVTNVVDERLSPTGADWDGVAELHFASAEDLARGLFDSPEGEREIRRDMERFIGHTFPYFVAEYVQKEAS
jgi:uncharacterized protein (TIGR02118 family)